MRLPVTYHQTGGANHIYLSAYKEWLATQIMTPNTLRVYYSRVKQFLLFVEYANLGDKPFNDAAGTNEAMSLYLQFLKQAKKGNVTVNANINALKNFAGFLGINSIELKRERFYSSPNKMLTLSEQERLLQTVKKESARDRAIVLILLYTGLRISECANLNLDNIGAGAACICFDAGVNIRLNEETKNALKEWLEERKRQTSSEDNGGLWLTKQGQRLSVAGIAFTVRRIGWQSNVLISAETLRRTGLSKAAESMNKSDLASTFGGYISAATLNRYDLGLSN